MAKKTASSSRYVAFLRGINVGGNKKVPMADLKKVMEKLGYKNVKTLLASGNVVYESDSADIKKMTEEIGAALEKKFKFNIPLLIRSVDDIQKFISKDPFKKIPVTKDTRLYVTFLGEKPKTKFPLPYKSPGGDMEILFLEDNALFTHLDVSKTGTIDAMNIIEKEFGKNVTTRNWNTVQKIAAL